MPRGVNPSRLRRRACRRQIGRAVAPDSPRRAVASFVVDPLTATDAQLSRGSAAVEEAAVPKDDRDAECRNRRANRSLERPENLCPLGGLAITRGLGCRESDASPAGAQRRRVGTRRMPIRGRTRNGRRPALSATSSDCCLRPWIRQSPSVRRDLSPGSVIDNAADFRFLAAEKKSDLCNESAPRRPSRSSRQAPSGLPLA
jgi:hypothetical protein